MNTISRKQFCQNLNTNSEAFRAKQAPTREEVNDTSVILLSVHCHWNQQTLTQFGTLCRLLLNFALKRIIIVIENNNYTSISNQIIDSILNDPFFISVSRIKQPKTSILIDHISLSYLRLPIHHLLNRFNLKEANANKLQIIIVHSNSISMSSLSHSKRNSFIYHLCNQNSLKTQFLALETLNNVLQIHNNRIPMTHIFGTHLDAVSINKHSQLSFISFLTFTFYTYRSHIALFEKTERKTEQKQIENENIYSECIPVLYEWKTGYNIGRVIRLCQMFKIPMFIHLFDESKLNLYKNHSFMSTISECCANNSDELKSMIEMNVIKDAQMGLKAMKNGSQKITILVMNQSIFLKLLEIDGRSLVILETVNFGKKTPPISLDQFINTSPSLHKQKWKWYGIVGRENYGIKPKYLYDMYKIFNAPSAKGKSMDKKKRCQVVYVETSKMLPSLNASTAVSLLIWANYCLCHVK